MVYCHQNVRTLLSSELVNNHYYCCLKCNSMFEIVIIFIIILMIRLILSVAPVITEPEEGYAHLSLKIGEPLNISCVAVGNPAPSVTWLKNSTGKAVSPISTNSQRLIIKSMEDKDFGLYSCIASNNLSHTMASVDIKKSTFISHFGAYIV